LELWTNCSPFHDPLWQYALPEEGCTYPSGVGPELPPVKEAFRNCDAVGERRRKAREEGL
jgi:hypothetical protein